MTNKNAKLILVAATGAAAAVALSCNLIRDVVLIPDGGGSCAGADFGMPCTGAIETGVLIADVQTEFVWA